jgi:DNA-binding GntR family transcriptional regulator
LRDGSAMTDPQDINLVRTGAAVDRVISSVLAQISAGSLGPGEQLRQEDLAEELGVSRVPVREALHALAQQRVLVHQKRRGFFVAKRSPSETAQFARMLQLIEDEVVSTIEWPDPTTLAHLRSLNRRMLALADDDDVTETFALNRDFHFTIFHLSPNKIMIDELERLWRLAHPHILMHMISPESRRQRAEEHEVIIAALVERDRQGAVTALGGHRRRVRTPRQDLESAETLPATAGAVGDADVIGPVPVRFLSPGA